jgi:hypothetical protein
VKKTRVNILSAVNADSIKIERTEVAGEKYAVIKNVLWMKDNIVLNDGLYSSSENAKGYSSMDGRVMPFGHPEVNGQYVAISSLDNADVAVALGKHYGGVHAQNVRQAGEEYFADVMINERVAKSHPDGEMLLNWVGKAEDYQVNGAAKPDPVHMSTGLMTARVNAKGESRGKSYSWIATQQSYDHLAILFHEQGAGGDEVAIAVNCESVINSVLPTVNEDALDDSYGEKLAILSEAVKERFATSDSYAYVQDFDDRALIYVTPEGTYTIDYHYEGDNPILAGESKVVTVETSYKVKTNSMIEHVRSVLKYFSTKTKQPVVANVTEESPDMKPEELQAALDAQADKLQGAFNTALAALEAKNAEALTAVNAKLHEAAESGLKDKRAAVAKVHGEVVANALSGEALDAMFASVQTAAGIVSGSPVINSGDEYKVPSMSDHFGGAK